MKDKWISVGKHLPKKDGRYWVATNENRVLDYSYESSERKWGYMDDHGCLNNTLPDDEVISYWQEYYTPDPPQQEY
jgi:hypothetical protein